MNIIDEIRDAESSFFKAFKIMPTALEIDVESYALLLDELCLDPLEEPLLWDCYKLIVDDYSEGKRLRFLLSQEV